MEWLKPVKRKAVGNGLRRCEGAFALLRGLTHR
jgi:hypothetical protein